MEHTSSVEPFILKMLQHGVLRDRSGVQDIMTGEIVHYDARMDALAVLQDKTDHYEWSFFGCFNRPTEADLRAFFAAIKPRIDKPIEAVFARNCMFWRLWPDHVQTVRTVFNEIMDSQLDQEGDLMKVRRGQR